MHECFERPPRYQKFNVCHGIHTKKKEDNDRKEDEDKKEEEEIIFDKYDYDKYYNLNVCKFFLPYFNNGCKCGNNCEYIHLSADEFPIYCKFINLTRNKLDKYSYYKFDKAIELFNKGFINNAYYKFGQLLTNYPYDAYFNFWMARCHQIFEKSTESDYECADFYYRKAISIMPKNAYFHHCYAKFCVFYGKYCSYSIDCKLYKFAKKHFEISLKLKNDSPKFICGYAKFLDETLGELSDAKFYYKQAMIIDTNNDRIHLNYARLLHKMGNYRLSKKEFLNIFDRFKNGKNNKNIPYNWIWLHFHFAKLLKDMKYYNQSKKHFEFCCNLMNKINNNFYSEIYYQYSLLLFNNLNQKKQANYYINLAINNDNNHFTNPSYNKLLYKIKASLLQ